MKENKKIQLAIPPGETIKEMLDYYQIRQDIFAAQLKLSRKSVKRLLCGEIKITAAIALELEKLFNCPAEFWLNLEQNYRHKLTKGWMTPSEYFNYYAKNNQK